VVGQFCSPADHAVRQTGGPTALNWERGGAYSRRSCRITDPALRLTWAGGSVICLELVLRRERGRGLCGVVGRRISDPPRTRIEEGEGAFGSAV
jgi:hypothetical protein